MYKWLTRSRDYPNTILDYPFVYSLEGVALDAMLDGSHTNTTCATSVTSSTITFPSHPPLPTEITTGSADDPEFSSTEVGISAAGMVGCRNVVIGDLTVKPNSVTTTTIVPVWKTGDVPIEFYRSAFSDERAFQKCKSSTGREVLGKITFVQAVQFLTETSTSYATGVEPIRTVEESGTQITTAEPVQSPTTTAKNIVSSDEGTPASKIIISPTQSAATSTQTLQITLGDTILPVTPTSFSASAGSGTSPALVPAFVIGTQTVTLGTDAVATVGGTPVAVQTSDGLTFAVIGNSAHATTVQLSPDPKSTITPPPIIVGGTTVPPSLQTIVPALVISGQTLLPGEAVILSGDKGAVVALATDPAGNSVLVAGGKTTTLASGAQTTPLVLAGYTLAPQPLSSGYILSGQTLTFGGTATIQDGVVTRALTLTTNSLGQTVLANNGQTTDIPSPAPTPLIFDGITLSPIVPSAVFEYHVADRILTLGGTITIGTVPSQTTLVLSTNSVGQTILVANGKPTTLIPSETSTKMTTGVPSTVGIADLVGSVMGLFGPATKISSTASVSFSLDSNVPTGTSTSASSSGNSLLTRVNHISGLRMLFIGLILHHWP